METEDADDIMQNASDAVCESIGAKCEPCRRRDRSVVASLFCNTCKVFLCDECCAEHKMHITNVDEHQILATHEARFKPKVDLKGLDQCIEHKRVFMFHCEDHDDLCCEICAFSRHRRCDNIHEIANVANNMKGDGREKIRALISTASEVIMKCKENHLNNVSRMEELVKEIDLNKETVLEKIEEAKAGIVSEMTNHNKQKDERLNARRNAAETLIKELDKHLKMAESVRRNGKETEMFILKHFLKRTQSNATQTLNSLMENEKTAKMELSINENILKMKTTDVALFSLKRTLEPKTQLLNGDVNNVQQRPMRLVLYKAIDLMKTENDKKQPFVTGLDFLPDGRIVAVDNCNCKCFILSETLKRYDTFYNFKTNPEDVTSHSDNNIAVILNARTICLLTVGSDHTITLMKTLNTSFYCVSICPLNDHTFVVSTWNDPRPARKIDVDGKVSDFNNVKFPNKTYKVAESNCTYIPSRDLLVLTDRYAHTVYMYNTVTGISTEVKGERIVKPKGACVGPNDSVFVYSGNTSSVVQISPEGVIQSTCDVDVTFPLNVAVSRSGTRMTMTNCENGVGKLKLFKILQ